MYQEITISRQVLYDEVWTHPMTTLAQKYGLSDVGLRKICKRMLIPLPPQGYHLRKSKGKSRRCLIALTFLKSTRSGYQRQSRTESGQMIQFLKSRSKEKLQTTSLGLTNLFL